MTDTVFLEPVSPHDRTILVQVRNTSDRADFDIADAVKASIAERGYRLVDAAGGGALPAPGQCPAGRPDLADRGRADFRGRLRRHADRWCCGRRRGADRQRRPACADRGRPDRRRRHLERRRRADRGRDLHHHHRCADLRARRRRRGGHRAARAEPAPGQRCAHHLGDPDPRLEALSDADHEHANRTNLDFEDAAPELVDGLTRSIAGIF